MTSPTDKPVMDPAAGAPPPAPPADDAPPMEASVTDAAPSSEGAPTEGSEDPNAVKPPTGA